MEIYTDGSMKSDGHDFTKGTGAWAFAVVENETVIFTKDGTSFDTTNQKMELTACAEALKYASLHKYPDETVIIYSDSAYLINCCSQKWYANWEKNGWKNSKKEPVANKELWEQIIPYFKQPNYIFNKVKGHADNCFNNICDNLAQSAVDRVRVNMEN